MDLQKAITELLNATGGDQYKLADDLGVKQPTISRWKNGVSKNPDLALTLKIQTKLVELGIDLKDEMPLFGYVGAGDVIDTTDLPESNEFIPRPTTMKDGSFALRVKGDSMIGWLDEGDLIYCEKETPDPAPLVNQLCAVKTIDNLMFVKRLKRGYIEETFNLESTNARTMDNVQLLWAARVAEFKKK